MKPAADDRAYAAFLRKTMRRLLYSIILLAFSAAFACPVAAQVQLNVRARQLTASMKKLPKYEQQLAVLMVYRVLIDRRPNYDDVTSQELADQVRSEKADIDQIAQLATEAQWPEYSHLLGKQWDLLHEFFAVRQQRPHSLVRKDIAALDERRQALEQQVIDQAEAANFPHPNPAFMSLAHDLTREIHTASNAYVEAHPVKPLMRDAR